jgi:excisionase family DNA binding protein
MSDENKTKSKKIEVPVWRKSALTLEEAAAYSGIGTTKLREITNDEDCLFVLWNGSKRLIKRRELDDFISRMYSI